MVFGGAFGWVGRALGNIFGLRLVWEIEYDFGRIVGVVTHDQPLKVAFSVLYENVTDMEASEESLWMNQSGGEVKLGCESPLRF